MALSGDVSQAFLQISVRPQDRDVFRFLLLLEGVVKHCRFKRLPFGSTTSPFFLNAVVRYHCNLFPDSEVSRNLPSNLYVDNYLSGGDSEEEATATFTEATDILATAGLHMKKWDSNNGRLIHLMEKQEVYKPEPKVLGVKWYPGVDVFTYAKVEYFEFVKTKRNLLALFSSIYDPLGLVGPFVLLAKVLFQESWRLGIGWDEMLPEPLADRLEEWIEGTKLLHQIKLPRQYFPGIPWEEVRDRVEVHAFGDACP